MMEQLGRNGASGIIADLQREKAEARAKALRGEGLDVTAAQLDVTDSRAVNGFFDEVVQQRGRLDILVNSAGVGQTVGPVVEKQCNVRWSP